MVIIGGALSNVSKFLLPSIQKVVEQRALENIRKHTAILDSAFGPDASVMGAVAMVVQAIFSSPNTVGPFVFPGSKRKARVHLTS